MNLLELGSVKISSCALTFARSLYTSSSCCRVESNPNYVARLPSSKKQVLSSVAPINEMYLSNNMELLARSAIPSQFSIKLIDNVYATPAQPKLTMHMIEMIIQEK